MATIRYFDAKGAISKQSLLGETGYLALADLFDLPEGATAVSTDSGSQLTQVISVGGSTLYTAVYDYSIITSPSSDKRLTQIKLWVVPSTLFDKNATSGAT